jgi:hypothetical protein
LRRSASAMTVTRDPIFSTAVSHEIILSSIGHI